MWDIRLQIIVYGGFENQIPVNGIIWIRLRNWNETRMGWLRIIPDTAHVVTLFEDVDALKRFLCEQVSKCLSDMDTKSCKICTLRPLSLTGLHQ